MTTLTHPKIDTTQALKTTSEIAGAFAALLGFIKWGYPRWKEARERKKMRLGMGNMAAVMMANMSVLSGIVHREHKLADRAIILNGHNGGGYPTPMTDWRCSAVLWETDREENYKTISGYQGLRVDAPYCEMICEVVSHGKALLETDQMKDGILKRLYQAEGVSHSVIILLGVHNKEVFYLSCARLSDVPFTNNDVTRLELAAQQIRNNYGFK